MTPPEISAIALEPLLPMGRQHSTDVSAGWLGFAFQPPAPTPQLHYLNSLNSCGYFENYIR